MTDFTAKERKVIEAAWFALAYCAETHTGTQIELADALKYETGSRTAGRQRIWAKVLIIDAYVEGRYGSTDERRNWLYSAARLSRGIRYGYLLACGNTFQAETEARVGLEAKCRAACEAYEAACDRRVPK